MLDYAGNLIRLGGVDMYETFYREESLEQVDAAEPRAPHVKKERKIYPGLRKLTPVDPMTGQAVVDGSKLLVTVHNVSAVAFTLKARYETVLLVKYACTTDEGARIDATAFITTETPHQKTREFFSDRGLAVSLPSPAKSLSWQIKGARKPATLTVAKKGKYWNVVEEHF